MKPFLAWMQAIGAGMLAQHIELTATGAVVCAAIGAVSYMFFIALIPEVETLNVDD